MAGRLINGVAYVGLMNDNSFKKYSLENNVYFTLRDIFRNGDINDAFTANYFNGVLTNNISFEEREDHFQYTNCLQEDYDYTKKLFDWLYRLSGIGMKTKWNPKDYIFEFYSLEEMEEEEPDMTEYMKNDDWYEQFLELISQLKEQLQKLKQKEENKSI